MIDHSSNPKSEPVFIVGTRRSGTTLLFQMLSGSSLLWCRNEIAKVHFALFRTQENSLQQTHTILKDMGLLDDAETHQFDKASELFDSAMSARASRHDRHRWCLKDPELTFYLDDYKACYPSAKFIIITRDPRAVANSFLTRGTSGNWYSAGRRWNDEVMSQLRFADAHSSHVVTLRYEDLISDCRTELRKLCEFLSIPLEDSILRYYERNEGIKIHEGNENVLKPLDPSINEKWRELLSTRQQSRVEYAAAQGMERLGYEAEIEGRPPSRVERLLFEIHNRIIQEWRWQRASRWFGVRKRLASLFGKKLTVDLSHTQGKMR